MRQFIYLIFISITLIACNPEKKAELTAKKHLKDVYHLEDEIETIDVKQRGSQIAFIVYALDLIFNGRNYDVSLQINEEYPIKVDGVVNNRRAKFEYDNYITSKHETLQKENKEYREMINQLSEMGINEFMIYDKYYDGSIRTIDNQIILDELDLDEEKLVTILHTISKKLLENVDSNISLQLTTNVNNYFINHISTSPIEIQLQPYNANEHDTLIHLLNNQLLALQTANLVNESMMEQFHTIKDKYNVFITRTDINYISEYRFDSALRLIRHEIEAEVLEGYNTDNLLDFFKWLNENGFEHSFIKLFFPEESSQFCQVKNTQTIDDLEQCINLN